MNIIKKSENTNNYVVTIAIGDEFYQEWESYILPSWLSYCDKHGLGLIVFENELIERDHPQWKKATWNKLLIGKVLEQKVKNINNVCFLDADILINPFSPNIFDYHDDDKISVISQIKLPYKHHRLLRKIAFFRNRYLSSDYPLDSALFISIEDYYKYHDFEPQKDIFCSGVFVFNIDVFSEIMEGWFSKYPSNVNTLTNGGDEPVFNYEFQNLGKIKWLDYKFQALWVYEMAEKYPFLYQQMDNQDLVNQCIRACLSQNYFLHFAGKWEGDMYKSNNIMSQDFSEELQDFNAYLDVPVTGKPLGSIYPKAK